MGLEDHIMAERRGERQADTLIYFMSEKGECYLCKVVASQMMAERSSSPMTSDAHFKSNMIMTSLLHAPKSYLHKVSDTRTYRRV